MKTTLTILFYVLVNTVLVAQQDSLHIYEIKYEKTITHTGSLKPFNSIYTYTKFIELGKSIFNSTTQAPESDKAKMSEDDDSVFYFTPGGKHTYSVYKNYNNNSFFAKHQLSNRFFLVKENLDVFNWKITETTKEILGYNCQLATTEYRGRQFKAWFTIDLPVGGPYKYDGLPGMILEIESTDGFIKFEAYGIKNTSIVKTDNVIENPFNSNKAYSWDDFSALYKKKALELINYKPTENSLGTIIGRCAIECYIKKDDEDYNNALTAQQKKISRFKN